MTEIALVGALCEAFGHPSSCTEPAPGSVESTSSHGITVTANGETHEVASIASADIVLPSHAHDYTDAEGCHQNESHAIDPTGEPSITINGSPVYKVDNSVTTDPITGGDVDITNNPVQTNRNI